MKIADNAYPLRPRPRWTTATQMQFAEHLVFGATVTEAARRVGLSRESAHRLRVTAKGRHFAIMWETALDLRYGRIPLIQHVELEPDAGVWLISAPPPATSVTL